VAGLTGAALDGEWWAARQVRIDGHDVTVGLPVRLTQHSTTIDLDSSRDAAAQGGELPLWSRRFDVER
jgi:hypothetical protein